MYVSHGDKYARAISSEQPVVGHYYFYFVPLPDELVHKIDTVEKSDIEYQEKELSYAVIVIVRRRPVY